MINAEESTIKTLERTRYLERLMPKICLQNFFRNKSLRCTHAKAFLEEKYEVKSEKISGLCCGVYKRRIYQASSSKEAFVENET